VLGKTAVLHEFLKFDDLEREIHAELQEFPQFCAKGQEIPAQFLRNCCGIRVGGWTIGAKHFMRLPAKGAKWKLLQLRNEQGSPTLLHRLASNSIERDMIQRQIIVA
jgi:hypothetical protein